MKDLAGCGCKGPVVGAVAGKVPKSEAASDMDLSDGLKYKIPTVVGR